MEPVSRTPTKPIDYAVLSAGYGALTGAVVVGARVRKGEAIGAEELPALGLATFALAKLVAKEKVDSWVREPFVEELSDGRRRPKGRRLRYAMGELLSCTRCVGSWSALGLVGLRTLRPREAQVVVPMLALAGANDFLQAGFTTLCRRANGIDPPSADAPAADNVRRFERPRH
jgi:hypothetical protein